MAVAIRKLRSRQSGILEPEFRVMSENESNGKRSLEIQADPEPTNEEGNRDAVISTDDDDYETVYFVIDFPDVEGTNLLHNTKRIKLQVSPASQFLSSHAAQSKSRFHDTYCLQNILSETPSCTLDDHLFEGSHGFSLGSRIIVDPEGITCVYCFLLKY